MNDSCRMAVKPLVVRLAYLTALASLAVSSSVYAISVGHSRLLSPVGQPLKIQVAVHDLTSQERESLSVSLAEPSAWQQAGLAPPVKLETMQVAVVDGLRPGSKLITVRSSQPLSTNVADLLLAVRSSSGQIQHQVSLLAPTNLEVARASGGITASGSGAVGASGAAAPTPSIQIRRGDTLFALARRHAISGVSVYQWMIGVMQANPQAFINDNVNLIKAGATLNVPGREQLTALSDREARDIFQKHANAFARYRQRLASEVAGAEAATTEPADSGQVTSPAVGSNPPARSQPQDRLVLQSPQASIAATESSSANPSSGRSATASSGSGGVSEQATNGVAGDGVAPVHNDDQLALERNTEEARERVNQLENNVKNLNQALQQQGSAARQAIVDGVKTVEDTVDQLKEMADGNTSDSEIALKNNGHNAGATPEGASAALGANTSSAAEVQSASKPSDAKVVASAENSNGNGSSLSTWFMNNLLIVISGALAFVVLIVAWLLRRVGAERDDDSDAVITEEMVRERLQSINLDLDDASETRNVETRK